MQGEMRMEADAAVLLMREDWGGRRVVCFSPENFFSSLYLSTSIACLCSFHASRVRLIYFVRFSSAHHSVRSCVGED